MLYSFRAHIIWRGLRWAFGFGHLGLSVEVLVCLVKPTLGKPLRRFRIRIYYLCLVLLGWVCGFGLCGVLVSRGDPFGYRGCRCIVGGDIVLFV